MPTLPWQRQQPIEPDGQYVALVSRLALKSHRSLPGFVSDSAAVRRQLAKTPGLMGYSLRAQPLSKVFWTYSVWQDQAALDAFVASDPHSRIMLRLQPFMESARFKVVAVTGASVPTKWDEMAAPLA